MAIVLKFETKETREMPIACRTCEFANVENDFCIDCEPEVTEMAFHNGIANERTITNAIALHAHHDRVRVEFDFNGLDDAMLICETCDAPIIAIGDYQDYAGNHNSFCVHILAIVDAINSGR